MPDTINKEDLDYANLSDDELRWVVDRSEEHLVVSAMAAVGKTVSEQEVHDKAYPPAGQVGHSDLGEGEEPTAPDAPGDFTDPDADEDESNPDDE